jgi:dipeptidase
MCDTFVTLPDRAKNHTILFAKNSDREPEEAQAIVRIPARQHSERTVRCTYIEVPQTERSYEVLLSKPFQMWGAEMGVNEHGVVIGNEAVFTRLRIEKKNTGLTGMDLIRLALERSRTARLALECIIEHLEMYGQDACGGYRNKGFFYHNSFLIADPKEAWVLETAGRHWVAQQVTHGVRSISNCLSIEKRYELISSEAIAYAKKRGWHRGPDESFNFRKAYSDWLYTTFGRARIRMNTTRGAAESCEAGVSVPDAIRILSSHNLPDPQFRPSKANTASICMHATGLLNPSTTTGSMIAALSTDGPITVWLTGTSMPCLSVYLPFFFRGRTLLDNWPLPGDTPDDSLWWQAELLHREICKDYQNRKALIDEERTTFQTRVLNEAEGLIELNPGAEALDSFSAHCLKEYRHLLEKWSATIATAPHKKSWWIP